MYAEYSQEMFSGSENLFIFQNFKNREDNRLNNNQSISL